MEFEKLLNMLQDLLSEKRWQTPSQGGTYQDEPILRPAAKIARPKTAKFRELRQIQRSPEAYWRSGDWLFYQQAKCMEDYTETGDSDISFTWASSTHASYASYATLTDKQLTAYFIWRTKVRQGNYPFAIPAFIAIYAFELLNQIGVSDSMDGLQKLQALKNAYCHETVDYLAHFVIRPELFQQWIDSYIICYGLSPDLLSETYRSERSDAMLTLLHWDEHTPAELCDTLSVCASYALNRSKFYQAYPEDVQTVTCRIFRALWQYYERYRKNDLFHALFPKKVQENVPMFPEAHFYPYRDENACLDRTYAVSELCTYTCRDGIWRLEQTIATQKNQKLGALLKAIDCAMRERYHYRYALKPPEIPQYMQKILEIELQDFLEQREEERRKQEEEAARVKIDFSQLAHIREAAAVTREKLLVDEAEEPALEPVSPEPAPAPPASAPVSEDSLLTPLEVQFLQCLFDHTSCEALCRKHGQMPSVVAEQINEKLFDQFADTVILFDGDTPELIEDYADDLKGMIAP